MKTELLNWITLVVAVAGLGRGLCPVPYHQEAEEDGIVRREMEILKSHPCASSKDCGTILGTGPQQHRKLADKMRKMIREG